jgi:hypothetical protein
MRNEGAYKNTIVYTFLRRIFRALPENPSKEIYLKYRKELMEKNPLPIRLSHNFVLDKIRRERVWRRVQLRINKLIMVINSFNLSLFL